MLYLTFTVKCTNHIFSFLLVAEKYVVGELIRYDYCNTLWLVSVMSKNDRLQIPKDIDNFYES